MTDSAVGAAGPPPDPAPDPAPGLLRRAARRSVDLLLPPRCLGCGAVAPADGGLCGRCWGGLSFIERPFCARCGLPFAATAALCGSCVAQRPAFDAARAVLRYDDASRRLILSFKHGDRMQAGRHFGGWMARVGADLVRQADLVAPVPLHWRRLAARRYNQSAELARGVAAAAVTAGSGPDAADSGEESPDAPTAPESPDSAASPDSAQNPHSRPRGRLCLDLLRRVRATPSQGGLARRARQRNVRGAFAVTPRRRAAVRGARILLVDDVLTTGATLDACARLLKRAGARRVDALVFARAARWE